MRRPAVIGVASFAVVVLAFALAAAVPFVTKKRDTPASITSPPPLESVSIVAVLPRHRVCMPTIALERYSRQARFRAGSYGKPGPPLNVTFSGGLNYAYDVPAGWRDNATLRVPIPPGRHDSLTTVCIGNAGKVPVGLYTAADRAQSRARAIENGGLAGGSPQFGFWEAKPVSIAARAPATVDRIAIFRGPIGKPWVVWIVLVLFLLGLPLAGGWLAWRSG